MRTAFATVCLSGGLNEKLRAIAGAGFKGVEIFENGLLSFNGTPRDARLPADDPGLEIVTFQPFRDFEEMLSWLLFSPASAPPRRKSASPRNRASPHTPSETDPPP